MSFAAEKFVNLLVLIPLLGVVFAAAFKKKELRLKNFADFPALKHIAGTRDIYAEKIKAGLVLLVAALSVLALMRPQWGFVWEEIEQSGTDIFVAVDVSKSMLTKDVLPSRLERAKLALEDLATKLPGDRIGLIAFSGEAFVQCPLTVDYDGFLLSVRDLNPEIIPRPGTNIESAIKKAAASFSSGSQGIDRSLIIITDGESHEGDARGAAEYAKTQKIKIYTIGVGTTQGELISVVDESGQSGFLKDSEGKVVKSSLNEELLREIALAADGAYVKSTATQFGLERIFQEKIQPREKSGLKSTTQKIFVERFQLPLLAAFILLLWESMLGNRKKDALRKSI